MKQMKLFHGISKLSINYCRYSPNAISRAGQLPAAAVVTEDMWRKVGGRPSRYFSTTSPETTPPLKSEANGEIPNSPNQRLFVFHTGGLTCNQWRKLKNLCYPSGKIMFRPNPNGNGKMLQSSAQVGHRAAGPTCVLYLKEGEASSKMIELLSSSYLESMGQDLLLLYGKQQTNLLDHLSVEKASSFDDELDASIFSFYLPTSYFSFMCSSEMKLD